MRLLADEGVDAAIVARLRFDGYDVVYVAELSPGITDDAVLELANAEERILMTADKDFGELVFRLRQLAIWRSAGAPAGLALGKQGGCRSAGDRRAR